MTSIAVRNPYTGKIDFEFTPASPAEVKAAVDRVRAGQPKWAAMGLERRATAMTQFADAIDRHFNALFAALKTDEARSRIADYEIHALRPMIERNIKDARAMLVDKPMRPTMTPGVEGGVQYVPFGVVGNIAPWNFPFILSMLDSVPALVSGNAVVLKPSEVAPRFVEPLRAAIADVPEIAAVFEIVLGAGATGAELINHVDLVVFTGSVRTGRKVAEAAARRFIPVFLELGGKDPAVVLASADVEAATAGILRGSIAATGQACQSLERVYVAAPIYEAFVKSIVAKAETVTLNVHQLEQGHIGPLIFDKQADTIKEHIDDAVAKGARVLTGGKIIDKGGKWIEPTVLVDVDHTMKVMTEETFGPVIPIMKFNTVDEAVQLANDSIYGLSASVFAGSLDEAMPVARRLNGGAVAINDGSLTAFVHDVETDSFGFSGLGGTRFGPEGVRRFVRRKALLNQTVGPRDINYEVVPLKH